MGLDMYLMKAPRLDSVTIQQVWATEEWFGYCKRPNEYRTASFEEWCGASQDDLPSEKVMEVLRPYYVERFASWDTNHVYPHSDIIQNVGYWRKANQIHRWFVDNVQAGDDDCDYHEECTKGIIEELLNTCKRVLNSSNPVSEAKRWLPVQEGFFFGGYEYDECYFDDLRHTVEVLENVLATTDFDNEMLYYVSSW